MALVTARPTVNPRLKKHPHGSSPTGKTRRSDNAVALQTDGKIITAGYGTNGLVTSSTATYASIIARVNADGCFLDTAFGTSGTIINASYGSSQARIVEILADGEILVAGMFKNTAGRILFMWTAMIKMERSTRRLAHPVQ